MKEFEVNMNNYFFAALKKYAGKTTSTAVVLSVNKENDTCEVEADSGIIPSARLRSVIDSSTDRIVCYPTVGSRVLYVLIENKNTDAAIVSVSSIASVHVSIGKFKLDLNADEIVINNGLNGGYVIAAKIVDKINDIEKKVNEIISGLKSVVIPLAPSGTYPLASDFSSIKTIKTTSVSDIENKKAKH